MRRLAAFLPVVILVVAPVLMLSTVWQDPLSAGEDDLVFFHPMRVLVGEAMADGEWPLANPYEATGTALMGDPQAAVMYPPTWLFVVLEPETAYPISIFLAFASAGIGMFLYLRRLRMHRAAALFGAVAFAYSGFMVGHRVHLGMIHTASFLPWILWCIEGLRRRAPTPLYGGRLRSFLVFVPVLFLAIVSGHWPTLIHLMLVCGIYFLVRARPFVPALAVASAAAVVALLLAGPQIQASVHLFEQATRQRLGLALAGENSFFPPAAVLILFPFLMGTRTPNLFDQAWWGPGHLCETLGYVGLVTLTLAAVAVIRLRRRPKEPALRAARAASPLAVVGPWTWIGAGALLFMLGYYLPTYRFVHAIPILGVVRCPARMILVLDLALATLGAVAVHAACMHDPARPLTPEPLPVDPRRSIRRAVTVLLPIAMLATLLLAAAAAVLLPAAWSERMPWPMEGGTDDILAAVTPTNPAVWIPLVLLALTVVAVRYWLRRPRRRTALLVALLLADLFVITRFVDVRAMDRPAVDPITSPAAVLLADPAFGDPKTYRVWGLDDSYHDRPAELLLPKSAHVLGFGTINGYGPFTALTHTHLFEFRPWGVTRSWRRVVRTNHLLTLYGVRYLLTADPTYAEVIEEVRIPAGPTAEDGENLLGPDWTCSSSTLADGVLHLHAPWLVPPSEAEQGVALTPNTTYRLSFDARGPDGGAGHYVRAEIREPLLGEHGFDEDPLALMAYGDQIGEAWQRFEWVFHTPEDTPEAVTLRVQSMSDRPVEVRAVALRETHGDTPLDVRGRLAPGETVYVRIAEVAPVDPGDTGVTIYENRLWEPVGTRTTIAARHEDLETVKWRPDAWHAEHPNAIPDVSFQPPPSPTRTLLRTSLPGFALYLCLLCYGIYRRRRGIA